MDAAAINTFFAPHRFLKNLNFRWGVGVCGGGGGVLEYNFLDVRVQIWVVKPTYIGHSPSRGRQPNSDSHTKMQQILRQGDFKRFFGLYSMNYIFQDSAVKTRHI